MFDTERDRERKKKITLSDCCGVVFLIFFLFACRSNIFAFKMILQKHSVKLLFHNKYHTTCYCAIFAEVV